jgi:hypothetical protein
MGATVLEHARIARDQRAGRHHCRAEDEAKHRGPWAVDPNVARDEDDESGHTAEESFDWHDPPRAPFRIRSFLAC